MAKNERYVTTIELNSQQATDRLKELEQKVKDLKKAKEDAAKSGGFFDEKELKKAVREFNQLNGQIKGIHGILENIDDMSLSGLQKAVRELKRQAANMLPDSEEWRNNQQQVLVLEDRIKQLKNSFREAKNESEQLTANMDQLVKVMQNIKGSSLNDLLSAQKILEQNVAAAKPGTTSYDTALAQLRDVKARIQEIKAEQNQIIQQIDKYEAEVAQANKTLQVTERETELIDRTMHNLSKANVRDLEYSIKIVNERLRELPRGTQEFERMQEQAKKLRTELERVRYESAAQQGMLSRMADFFNKVQGTVIVGLSSITGLTLTVRRAIQAFADMDQEMENVRKYTGQTTEQVHEMNEEFKQMDTRTSREKMNQLAGDAGRLGIQGKEAIMDFVDAADKINVALGDDLGEGAVKNIGKLAMSFGTDKKMGLRGAMLATGSAVNELSQNSSAAANYLVDFTARVAGFGKQVGLTQTQIMGFGAVMDENMLRDEMAATAFGQLLVKMTTDIDTFARITGKTSEEFKKMVTEDINGAILTVARSLKGRDMQDLGKVFDAMNLDGQRAIGVLATLGEKVDDVAERQRIANEAFKNATSITEEYNIQNTTAQAGIEKAKKRFNELRVELGEKLLPVARYGITTTSMLIEVISAIIGLIFKYKSTITALTTVITVLIVKKELDIALTKLQVFWTGKLAKAIERLYLAVIKNPWTAAAAAVVVMIGVIADLIRKSNEAETATKRLNKVRDEAAKKYGEEKTKLELLLGTARNEKASLDKRKEAIEELNRIIPNYNAQLDETTGKYVENKRALDDYLVSLARKFELEGAEDMLKEIGGKVAKATVEIDRLKKDLEDEEVREGELARSTGGVYGKTKADEIRENLREQNEVIEEAGRSRKAIYKAYPELLGQEPEGLFNIYVPHDEHYTPPQEEKKEPFTDPKDEEKKRKAAEAAAKKLEAQQKKELKERNDAIKAQTEQELAIAMNRYAKGEIDYRKYISEIDRIQLEGFNKRMAIYDEESDEYKKILNDRETYFLKSVERQERMNQREVELVHQSVVAELQSKQWNDEGEYLEALYWEDINYLQNKAALYRKGSEERVEIEEEITEREYQHQLERQQRYAEMVEELRERYLNMGNQRQMEIALNGLEELHRRGRIKEEEYQRARIAIQAQYASAVSPTEQIRQTGSQMLANARNNVNKNAQENKTNYSTPFVGAIQEYQATMEQLRILYANDNKNYAAYQYAKQQATAEFCADLVSQFQAAYNSINQVTSAASSYFSAAQEYETAQVKKKYEKQIAAAGNNQKRVKKLQEKQAKEEAAIKNKYNAKQMKVQMAQAFSQMAVNALTAYGAGLQVGGPAAPIVAAAFAAMALAAGMIQIAAIQKQQEAQKEGYYSGGYTGGRQYRKEAGVVHQGEFVANHQAVDNPNVRPMLDFIDKAQRNNTVGSLTAEDISRQLGQGGSAVVTPIVNIQNDNEEMRQSLDRNSEATEALYTVVTENGIKILFPMDSFDREYKHFTKLNDR